MHNLPTDISTVVDLLRFRATHQADQLAYLFLPDGETREIRLTYGDLDRRARTLAGALQHRGAVGARVLLLYPYGLEYISAFFGCLYAGAVAVPASLPDFARGRPALLRIQALARDARSALTLTSAQTLAKLKAVLRGQQDFLAGEVLATDSLPEESAVAWQAGGVTGSTLALLQYASSSTMAPQGVMITQHNLLYNQQMMQEALGHPARAPSVSWFPLSHQMGLVGSVLQALYADAPCILLPPAAFWQKPVRWLQAISRYRGRISGAPNIAYEFCARRVSAEQRATLDLSSWKVAVNGSEPIHQESLQAFLDRFAPCHFQPEAWYPLYSLAEATAFVAGGRPSTPPAVCSPEVSHAPGVPEAGRAYVSCGRAWLEERLLIVDPEQRTICPPGQIGEIWLAGPHVAQGYWNNRQATRHTFGASLYSGEGPFLRTGDLGFLKDGELFVTGRCQDLIVIRGLTCYPQDIAMTVGRCHPRFCALACAAFSVAFEREERLVIVQEVECQASQTELAQAMAQMRVRVAAEHGLAIHAIVLVRALCLPRTADGAIQHAETHRRFLAGTLEILCQSISPQAWADEGSNVPPHLVGQMMRSIPEEQRQPLIESYLQGQIVRATGYDPGTMDWRQPIDGLGVDSLTRMELRHQLEADLEILLPPDELFGAWTLAQLAGALASLCRPGPAGLPAAGVFPVAQELCTASALSPVQQGLWFLHQLRPASSEHQLAFCLLFSGRLNIAFLQRALNEIVARHAVLRATLVERDGTAEMQIKAFRAFDLLVQECPGVGEEHEEARRQVYAQASRPFDLGRGPLYRFLLLRSSSDEHVLCVHVHRLVFDRWSLGVFLRELAALYRAFVSGQTSAVLPALPAQYTGYVTWQQSWLQSAQSSAQLAYWRQQLAGIPAALHLPADHPRPAQRSWRGARYSFALPLELVERLRHFSRRQQTTLFSTLLAAFQVLLFRYSGQQDVVVGIPVSGRRQAVLKDLIGCFVNLLAIRSACCASVDFLTVLHRVQATLLAAYARADVPFETVVEALGPQRDLSCTPVFQVTFAMQTLSTQQAGSLTIAPQEMSNGSARYDLSLSLLETPDALSGSVDYSSDLFALSTIQRFVHHFQVLLHSIVDFPRLRIADLALLTPGERAQLVMRWSTTRAGYACHQCLPQIFEARAQSDSEAIALVCGARQLSYGDLNLRANQLAHALQRLGVGTERVVAVYMHRSLELVIALLAVLKAGGACLPLDPIYPRKRLAWMLADAHVSVVLTLERLREYIAPGDVSLLCLDQEWSELARDCPTDPAQRTQLENLAWVIYPPGSLGTLTGVHLTHRGLANLVGWHQQAFALTARDRATQLASWSFDAAGWELWPYLAAGATVHLVEEDLLRDPRRLRTWLGEQQITRSFLPTSLAESLLAEEEPLGSHLITLLTGGELLHREPARRLPFVLVNTYGPTENTVVTTSGVVESGSQRRLAPALGRPIGNVQVYILDSSLQPVPVGVVGELAIGGAGLARGYGWQAELTAERFVPDPFSAMPGARLYRTGDLVRSLPDGNLAFVGRVDQQLKIGGVRIESGEIERALQEMAEVRAAAVVVREDRPAHRSVVAYVVPTGPAVDPQMLQRHLRTRIPAYMAPTSLVLLEALPLTPHGKVDHRALPMPEKQRARRFVAPRTPIEATLARIWGELLGVSHIGMEDNFLAAGGHSLLATRVTASIKQCFQVDISVQRFFETRCLAELAALVAEYQAEQEEARPIAEEAAQWHLRARQSQSEGGT
ncbi:MAG TPA: amino acid adenylation domain-containing protein [Ktedonobacteraceae bacterium]|jgi:amino acid adenylation domain-containing protein